MNIKKFYKILGLATGVLAVAAIGTFVKPYIPSTSTADAQVSGAASNVTVGISVTGVTFGNVTAVAYPGTTDPSAEVWTEAAQQLPNANYDGVPDMIYINTSTFSVDFRIGIKICEGPGTGDGEGTNCHEGWTPWASDIASGAAQNGFTPIVGAGPLDGGTVCGANTATLHNRQGDVYLAAQYRALPANTVLNNVSLTLFPLEYDFNVPVDTSIVTGFYPTPSCDPLTGVGTPGYTAGGWSSNAFDKWNNDSTDGFVIQLAAGATSYNAAFVSSNIPSTATAGQVITTGTDGKPLEITMQNTGSDVWPSQLVGAAGPGTGNCTASALGGANNAPPVGDSTDSCTVNYTYTGTLDMLRHVSGSAVPNTDPMTFTQTVPITTVWNPTSTRTVIEKLPCSNPSQPGGPVGAFNKILGSFVRTADAACTPNQTTTVDETIGPYYSQSRGGVDAGIWPNGTAVFTMSSLTAPSTSDTEKWQMEDAGTSYGNAAAIPITISGGALPPPTSNATVSVSSQNSVNGGGVYAGWYFESYPTSTIDPSYDPCGDQNSICNYNLYETSSTSLNAPTGTYTLYGTPTLAPINPQYTFRSIQTVSPIAFHSDSNAKANADSNSLFALAKELLPPVANAAHEDTSYPWSQTATSTNSNLAMIILWDPVATLTVSSPVVSVDSSNPTGSFSVSNTGTQGSSINWNTVVSNYSANSNGNNWLSVSPSSGSGLTAGSPAVNVTITATPGSLATGTYTATVSFDSNSTVTEPSGQQIINSQKLPSVTVTFAVNGNGNPPPSSCTASTVTVSCPASMQENTSAQCLASVNESGNSCTGTVTWSVVSGGGSITQNGNYTSPGTAGTAVIKAVSTDSSGVSNTADITINAPPLAACTPGVTCPVCSNPIISATPTSIVVPESSNLSYSCHNVTACSLTGNDGSNYPITWIDATTASGTQPVHPAATTVYTFTCTNSNYSPQSATVSLPVQVTVGGTSRCEQNPNGAGCPGQ